MPATRGPPTRAAAIGREAPPRRRSSSRRVGWTGCTQSWTRCTGQASRGGRASRARASTATSRSAEYHAAREEQSFWRVVSGAGGPAPTRRRGRAGGCERASHGRLGGARRDGWRRAHVHRRRGGRRRSGLRSPRQRVARRRGASARPPAPGRCPDPSRVRALQGALGRLARSRRSLVRPAPEEPVRNDHDQADQGTRRAGPPRSRTAGEDRTPSKNRPKPMNRPMPVSRIGMPPRLISLARSAGRRARTRARPPGRDEAQA